MIVRVVLIVLFLSIILPVNAIEFYATYYDPSLHGNKTSSGEKFSNYKYTCASKFFKNGTWLKITNKKNNKSVLVRVNDTNANIDNIDLSIISFKKIGNIKDGNIKIEVKKYVK